MSFALRDNGGYTQRDLIIFKEICRVKGGRVTAGDLMESVYKGRTVPAHGRVAIVGALKSLGNKMARNNEPFKMQRTKRRGPHPIEFWIEKAK